MTRRVSEDGLGKTAVQGKWGVEDLRERPAPESEAGGAFPWARRRRRANQIITTATQTLVDYDDDTNNYTGNFTIETIGGEKSIRVKQDGLYSFLFTVTCSSLTEWLIDFNVRPDGDPEIYSYPFTVGQLGTDFRSAASASMTIRMGIDQWVNVIIAHRAGADRTIRDGTFLEVVYHGSSTVTGLDWP